MKTRILSILLAAVTILSLTACGKAQEPQQTPEPSAPAAEPAPMTGGWAVTPADAHPLPEAAQTAFDKAMETKQDNAAYTPVALLSSQLVAGTNYCVFCQVIPAEAAAVPFWALVYIYADLQGNAEITNVYDLDIPRHWAPAG